EPIRACRGRTPRHAATILADPAALSVTWRHADARSGSPGACRAVHGTARFDRLRSLQRRTVAAVHHPAKLEAPAHLDASPATAAACQTVSQGVSGARGDARLPGEHQRLDYERG